MSYSIRFQLTFWCRHWVSKVAFIVMDKVGKTQVVTNGFIVVAKTFSIMALSFSPLPAHAHSLLCRSYVWSCSFYQDYRLLGDLNTSKGVFNVLLVYTAWPADADDRRVRFISDKCRRHSYVNRFPRAWRSSHCPNSYIRARVDARSVQFVMVRSFNYLWCEWILTSEVCGIFWTNWVNLQQL